MATIIHAKHRGNHDRHQRWTRLERADLLARYGELHAQKVSQRQAAKVLDVPRSTRQAWRACIWGAQKHQYATGARSRLSRAS
jgi:hypothetical protein